MDAQDALQALNRYESEINGILSRFTHTKESTDIQRDDEPKYRQLVLELIDLLEDSLGPTAYPTLIAHEFESGRDNYFRSTSYNSVQSILSTLRAIITRVERNPALVVTKAPQPKETITDQPTGVDWNLLHPRVVAIAKPRFEAGMFADSVLTVLIELNAEVRKIHMSTGGEELDGVALMRKAFTPNNPTIVLDDLSTETGKNIQQGHMDLFAGSMAGIRNPKAHENLIISPERAIHHLFIASLLFSKLDERISPVIEK